MAEFVEFRAEEWMAELEQMERIRLFESKEIKSIATKRKEFEYKIQRRTKCKEDFLKYIQFEIDLHRIIKARRKKAGIKAKTKEIDFSQTHRIANLFKQVIFKFQDDVKLWMSFFKFCEGVKFHSLVSQMLVRMLQIHSNKADLWVFAAKWELNQCRSISNARQFLTRGLRHHPSSELLYQELFKLELEHIKWTEREKEKKEDKIEGWAPDEVMINVIKGKVAEIVYVSAVKTIQGVEFKVSLFNIAQQKRAPVYIKNKIFQDIVKNHLDEELTWDTVAKQELKGVHYDLKQIIEEEPMEVDEEKSKEKATKREMIQRSISVYEEAVGRLNSLKMWGFYLDFVIKLNKNVQVLPIFKYNLLNKAMEEAASSGNIEEKYYIEWIKVLENTKGKNKKLLEVLKEATEHHPKSLHIWLYRLRFYFSRDLQEPGMKAFEEAIQHLPDAAPLWSLAVQYLKFKSAPEIGELFQNGLQRGGEVSQALKPLYVDWLVREKGMTEARKVFESPEMNLPPCLEIYRKMADLELSQSPPCLEKVRRCHELACSNFGKNDSSVWLDYIKFELKKGDNSKISQIYRRALTALSSEQADEFVSEYNHIKVESV